MKLLIRFWSMTEADVSSWLIFPFIMVVVFFVAIFLCATISFILFCVIFVCNAHLSINGSSKGLLEKWKKPATAQHAIK